MSTVLLSGSPMSQLCIKNAIAGDTVTRTRSPSSMPSTLREFRSWYPWMYACRGASLAASLLHGRDAAARDYRSDFVYLSDICRMQRDHALRAQSVVSMICCMRCPTGDSDNGNRGFCKLRWLCSSSQNKKPVECLQVAFLYVACAAAHAWAWPWLLSRSGRAPVHCQSELCVTDFFGARSGSRQLGRFCGIWDGQYAK